MTSNVDGLVNPPVCSVRWRSAPRSAWSSLVSVGGALLLAGEEMSAALAIGGMGAIWGGLGFVSMIGGVTYMTRHEDD